MYNMQQMWQAILFRATKVQCHHGIKYVSYTAASVAQWWKNIWAGCAVIEILEEDVSGLVIVAALQRKSQGPRQTEINKNYNLWTVVQNKNGNRQFIQQTQAR